MKRFYYFWIAQSHEIGIEMVYWYWILRPIISYTFINCFNHNKFICFFILVSYFYFALMDTLAGTKLFEMLKLLVMSMICWLLFDNKRSICCKLVMGIQGSYAFTCLEDVGTVRWARIRGLHRPLLVTFYELL